MIGSSVSNSVMVVAEGFQLDDETRLESGLLREAGSVLHGLCWGGGGGVAAAATSPVVFAEDITVGVYVTSLHRMSTEVMQSVFGRGFFPSGAGYSIP